MTSFQFPVTPMKSGTANYHQDTGALQCSGGCFIIKILSYQWRNFHYKDKTVSQPSYLYSVNTILGKMVFILKWPQVTMLLSDSIIVALVFLCLCL